MSNILGDRNISLSSISDSTINITQYTNKSAEYRQLKERLEELEMFIKKIPVTETIERLAYSQKITDQKQRIASFEQDVRTLAATFERTNINTEVLKVAKEHFDSGEFTSARGVLKAENNTMTKETNNRVFLSYAHDNLDMVRKVYDALIERKVNVWFDKVDLGPGKWKKQIEKTIPKCRYFVVCISETALRKTGDEDPGFLDDEIQQAYEIARVQPESSFTIIPVRLEDCDRGDHRLAPEQQYDLFEDFDSELDRLSIKIGGVSLADKFAEDTRTEDEKLIESLMGKAGTFFFAGDLENAFELYGSVTTLNPDHSNAWFNKGRILLGLGRFEEALEAFDNVLEINTTNARVWYSKGWVLNKLGKNEEAQNCFKKIEELKSKGITL